MGVLTFRNFGILERLVASGYLELIEDIEVTGSSVTSVQFSGFTATKEDTLVLVSDFNNTTTTSNYWLYANNNQTATNYYMQGFWRGSTILSAYRNNNAGFSYSTTSFKSNSITEIKLTNDGYFTAQTSSSQDYGGSGQAAQDFVLTQTSTITSITQLDIVAQIASAIGIGSRFQLYKVVA